MAVCVFVGDSVCSVCLGMRMLGCVPVGLCGCVSMSMGVIVCVVCI